MGLPAAPKMRLRKGMPNNKTGISGVYYCGQQNRWRVTWGKTNIGQTKDFFEACCIRKSFEARL